mmetsp:Transcript_45086/g.89346  ORF Transcript_45086/g.89346 Transcript_45086/m.89346 type:complete len:104 (-) Transcript_45086:70-381(-)
MEAITVQPAFPASATAPIGHVVLEASHLIKSTADETLASLIQARCPQLLVEEYMGERSYARIRVTLEAEDAVRDIIKTIARERGKKPHVREVRGTRQYYSPRD